jgi:imidazolonepropionase-like amidohydrolase
MNTLRLRFLLVLLALLPALARGEALSPQVRAFVRVDAPIVALTHVRVIDGTGAPAVEDRTILIENGKIAGVGTTAGVGIPDGAEVLALDGYTVIPGLVGMHNHLFDTAWRNVDEDGKLQPPGFLVSEIAFSAPRLYLAAGVTTLRTTGNVEGYTDLEVKRAIDAGRCPGPDMDATAPYLEGPGSIFTQMHQLKDAEDARHMVAFWASQGATSFKAYMNITRDELRAAIEAAHALGLKVTGHLCSVTWREAIALGIDDLEHGPVFTATDFQKDKQADACPASGTSAWSDLRIESPEVQALVQDLVSHHVAVTSTLPVFDASTLDGPPNPRVLAALSPTQRQSFLTARARMTPAANARLTALLEKEMAFERAFVEAGGLLLAGPDPTGNGGTLPGFGDWREIQLLVKAGFTPVEAIRIASGNGASFLGRADRIGTIDPGKDADLVVIKGNPAVAIGELSDVEIVFKKGVGFDSRKLVQSVEGTVGVR